MPVSALTVVGARPQSVKVAAVSTAIAGIHGASSETIVHAGLHFDSLLSEIFFDELVIPAPGYNLGVGPAGHGAQTREPTVRLEPNHRCLPGRDHWCRASALSLLRGGIGAVPRRACSRGGRRAASACQQVRNPDR